MPKAVRYDQFGELERLYIADVERLKAGNGEILVRVKAAGTNPGESSIRRGRFATQWPSTFPSGQGADLAGIIEEIGSGVTGFAVGDEVLGFTNNRASQAEFVIVTPDHIIHKPANVSWEVAGSLFVVGTTAYAAVEAVAPKPGETVVVSAATGGVGSVATQLAARTGAKVIGISSPERHHWLTNHGIIPVSYEGDIAANITKVAGGHIDAFIDTFGGDYVHIALKLGVDPKRINTIINFEAVGKYGVQAKGSAEAANTETLTILADLISTGHLEVPIAHVYLLAQVREAYQELEKHHAFGKIVLIP